MLSLFHFGVVTYLDYSICSCVLINLVSLQQITA